MTFTIPRQAHQFQNSLAALFPGLAICLLVVSGANTIASVVGGPLFLMVMLVAMALSMFGQQAVSRPGVAFSSRTVLRLGVALLGVNVTGADVVGLGWEPLVVMCATTAGLIGLGVLACRWLGLSPWFGLLSAGAVAICGASAAMAIAATTPPGRLDSREISFTVVTVTLLSTLCMLAYPLIALALGLSDRAAGFFFGATIHDVAQVVGAGFSVSQHAGETAVIAKLFRVSLLVPVVFSIAMLAYRDKRASQSRAFPLPLFLCGFVALAALNSLGAVPEAAGKTIAGVSQICLLIGVAAIGLKTPLAELKDVGVVPALVIVGETIVIGLTGAIFASILF